MTSTTFFPLRITDAHGERQSCDGQQSRYVGLRRLSTQEVDAFLVLTFSHLFVLCIAFPCSMETVPGQNEERRPSCHLCL